MRQFFTYLWLGKLWAQRVLYVNKCPCASGAGTCQVSPVTWKEDRRVEFASAQERPHCPTLGPCSLPSQANPSIRLWSHCKWAWFPLWQQLPVLISSSWGGWLLQKVTTPPLCWRADLFQASPKTSLERGSGRKPNRGDLGTLLFF